MTIIDPAFQECIIDLVNGTWNLKEYPLPESAFVRNEFSADSACNHAYSQMLDAYSRLCRRLGTEEWDDEDVETVIDSLLWIGKHFSLKMFEYGVFSRQYRTQPESQCLPDACDPLNP